MRLFRLIPPPITAILLLLIAHSVSFVHVVLFQSLLLAIMLAVVGFVFMLWPLVLFRKSQTTLNPNKKPSRLIVYGPYKVTRNPMYVGIVLVMISCACWQGTIGMYLASLVFFVLMDRIVIPYEELLAKDSLGNTYKEYTQKIRRWI